ncbi:serine/threonine-protein phosphatase 6 regulatory ankyrin repeat subunit A-like [Exaiptasia diaphana]|uniref:Uncharacterized protein n=1 Tax=Exaiptasia diaphana TaxID=2652724 RepID=A0A913YIX7_EXADI|nr:serine/threonine-protein phosphatase 6 regulatory ankyrin repeat subunit A-like [Exaiptasia diaphana]
MAGVDSAGISLTKVVLHGDLEQVHRLIEGGASVNAVNKYDQTALTIVAQNRTSFTPEMAISLMSGEADVNMKDKKGNTALMYAICRLKVDTALAIIEQSNLDPNAVDYRGQTALMKAAFSGMSKVVSPLLQCGADVNIQDKKGKTALMHAIARIEKRIALAIIKHSKDLDSNAVDNQGQTALIRAAFGGMTTIVDALITRGADVNIKDKKGNTALMHAIAQKSEDIALAIVKRSKDLKLNAVDNRGQTALMKAAINIMSTIAVELTKSGADVNMKDEEGKTALMHAIAQRDEDTALAIIENSKDLHLNGVDNQGQTALMKAVIHRKTKVVQALIQFNALVDTKNHLGRTALFYALVESNLSARYLVENGANLHMTDNCNVSALSYFIHHCINNGGADEKLMEEKFALLKDNGVERETIVNALINAIFCKLPLLKSPVNTISITSITSCLAYASKLSKKRFSFTKDNKCRLLQDLIVSIERDGYLMSVSDLSIRLDKLLELDADPNTCDEQGNTIAHYITLLGMYDNSFEDKIVFDVLLWLEKKGLKINKKNCNKERPLLLMLTKAVNHDERIRLNDKFILDVCNVFLGKYRATLKETSQTGDSVLHLLIKLSSLGDINEESLERCIVELLRLFSHQRCELSRIVNMPNNEMNTPLHVWAAGRSKPKSRAWEHNQHASEKMDWQGPSENILDQLLCCGAVHHARNLKAETPLHMCRTWTAVKLLFKAGAKTNDVDTLGRSPLLSAAKNCLFLNNPGCFYPDVSPDEAPTFWKTVMDMGFDLWTCENIGDSIIKQPKSIG